MKYVKEFRNPLFVKGMLEKIGKEIDREIVIMEVCGTHTMAIFKSGIRSLLPKNIKLISGPGCPVCVTPQSYVDTAIQLSQNPEIIITTFGDFIKVPGSTSSLQKEKARGGDIRIVYTPLEALKIAEENPKKEVVFLAIGFETTAPIIALCLKNAKEGRIKNFSILHSLKTMPNAMGKLVMDEAVKVDGFLCPGHVSTIIGVKGFETLAKESNIPFVIAGFEAGDIMLALDHLLEMIITGRRGIINNYSRFVREEGNKKALDCIEEVFEIAPSTWRGLGTIENTGLRLKHSYDCFDTLKKLGISMAKDVTPKGCICGEILKGIKQPTDCSLYGSHCNPENPVGACMVSEEGTCAAYYKYKINKGA